MIASLFLPHHFNYTSMPVPRDYAALVGASPRELLAELLRGQDRIMTQISEVKDELVAAKGELEASLETIKGVVANATAQQAKIDSLTAQVNALVAGDAVTQAAIDDLKSTVDGVKSDADAIQAAVSPVAPA